MNSSDNIILPEELLKKVIILPEELLKKVYFKQYDEKEINKKKINFLQLQEKELNLEDFFYYFPEKIKFVPKNFTHFYTITNGNELIHCFNIHIRKDGSIKVTWSLDFYAEVLKG